MCQLLYPPSPSVKAVIQKKPGFDTPTDLKEPPGEAGSNRTCPKNTDAGSINLGELIPP